LMTAMLTAIYVVVATQSAKFLQTFTGTSELMYSIVAACLIAVLFHPLQVKVQAFVDKQLFPGWKDREVAREIAAGFSHELKSPLAALSMRAQMILSEVDDAERRYPALSKMLPKIKTELWQLVHQSMEAAKKVEAVRGVAEPVAGQMEAVDV